MAMKTRSKMEARIVPSLVALGCEYEAINIPFQPKQRFYKPDLILPNGIVVELKGWFQSADRAKLIRVKEQYPALELRMILTWPHRGITKTSFTTEGGWCDQHGIPWAAADVPARWLSENPWIESLKIINSLRRKK